MSAPTTQTTRREPPFRFPHEAMDQWHLETQRHSPLITVDTSSGSQHIVLPSPGLQANTGATNQNQELTYVKSSADANTVKLTGAQGDPYMLVAQFDSQKFKSDGQYWWPVS